LKIRESPETFSPFHHHRTTDLSKDSETPIQKGPVEYFTPIAIKAPDEPRTVKGRECSKKSVQQGRSPFDARSALIVREHGKMARTPLAAFFNIPKKYHTALGNLPHIDLGNWGSSGS